MRRSGRVTSSADTRIGALLAVLLLAVNVASVASQLGFLHKPKQVKEYDHWRYIEMARGPAGRPALQQEPPYCFRIVIPALVRGLTRLGLGENAAFFLVTNAVLFGFLLVLWLHLRDLGFSLALRVAGLLVVGFTQGAVRWFEYQYWMTDPAALFLVMLAFFLLERGRWGPLLAASVLAAFVRETYVLVYPYVSCGSCGQVARSWPPRGAPWRSPPCPSPSSSRSGGWWCRTSPTTSSPASSTA